MMIAPIRKIDVLDYSDSYSYTLCSIIYEISLGNNFNCLRLVCLSWLKFYDASTKVHVRIVLVQLNKKLARFQ